VSYESLYRTDTVCSRVSLGDESWLRPEVRGASRGKDVDSEELVCESLRESYAIVQPQTQEVSVGSLNEFIPPRWRSRGGLVTCAA